MEFRFECFVVGVPDLHPVRFKCGQDVLRLEVHLAFHLGSDFVGDVALELELDSEDVVGVLLD